MTRGIFSLLLCAAVSATFVVGAHAGVVPKPGPTDPRIRTVTYDPNDVVSLRGHLGYQMMVEFDPNERIENVSIGDSTVWQVTPNRKATLLFLKPMERNATTNMTVVTTQRRYAFELTTAEAKGPQDPTIIFDVRFSYPEEAHPIEVVTPPEPPPAPSIDQLNFAYEKSGSKRIAPMEIFDDGQMTYFQFPEQMETPAIFTRDSDGHDSLINFQVRGRYFVVEALAPAFTLKLGADQMIVKNNAYKSPEAAAAAPSFLSRLVEGKP